MNIKKPFDTSSAEGSLEHSQEQSHFIHRITYNKRERMVGAFVLIAVALFLAQLIISSQIGEIFEDTREYIIELKNPIGVSADTKVRVSGLDIGWVEKVDLSERNTFVIYLTIYEKFHALVRQDSRAQISKLAVVGDSVINISPGDIALPALVDGAHIQTEEGMTMDDILARLEPVLEQAELGVVRLSELLAALPTNAVPDILASLQNSAHNIESLTKSVQSGEGSFGSLLKGEALSRSLQNAFDNSNAAILEGEKLIKNTDANIEQLPAILKKLDGLLETLQDSAAEIPELLTDTEQLVDDSNAVVDSLSETWPISAGMNGTQEPIRKLPALPAN